MHASGTALLTPEPQSALGDTLAKPPTHLAVGLSQPQAVQPRVSSTPVPIRSFVA